MLVVLIQSSFRHQCADAYVRALDPAVVLLGEQVVNLGAVTTEAELLRIALLQPRGLCPRGLCPLPFATEARMA